MIMCERLCLWTIVVCAIPLFTDAGFFRDTPASTPTKKSLFHVDPQNIIRLICKHGGVVLPESIKKDIDVISSVCECDETSLDLINKELVVKGFRVSNPHAGEKTALMVGRFSLSWDSYLKPCIDIEVEDVDILIEFINLILSKNNWNELSDIGFPPQLYDEDDITGGQTFVRVGGIAMKGEIRLKLRSRPLDKDIHEDIVFDFGNLRDLSKQISAVSKVAYEKTGRRGCTTEELYDIIQSYFNRQIHQLVKSTALDIALGVLKPENGGKTAKDAKKILSIGRDVAMRYAKDIEKKADEHVDNNFKTLGVSRSDFNLMARDILKSSKFFANRETENEDLFDDDEYPAYVVETDDSSDEQNVLEKDVNSGDGFY